MRCTGCCYFTPSSYIASEGCEARVVCHQKKAATCSERLTPPPLPGGYKVGEKVFFTGASQTISSGNKLVHGQQGEVKGPATFESVKGKGVCVPLLFPGNKGSVDFFLTSVPRLHAASAATPRLRPTHATLPTRRCPHATLLIKGELRASGRKVVH